MGKMDFRFRDENKRIHDYQTAPCFDAFSAFWAARKHNSDSANSRSRRSSWLAISCRLRINFSGIISKNLLRSIHDDEERQRYSCCMNLLSARCSSICRYTAFSLTLETPTGVAHPEMMMAIADITMPDTIRRGRFFVLKNSGCILFSFSGCPVHSRQSLDGSILKNQANYRPPGRGH